MAGETGWGERAALGKLEQYTRAQRVLPGVGAHVLDRPLQGPCALTGHGTGCRHGGTAQNRARHSKESDTSTPASEVLRAQDTLQRQGHMSALLASHS
ncbi:hypothetical protein NDU88_005627 [Pleurodeles waltl]|uniref:Uncharacterized protein n=1 Tax=Pleurodeles waltl TaxID=8319 RepID=A0AAV7WB74_PLEWA|nr:hypothetical protein NDU88_005627 [Pleurodeles waltl]